MSQPEPCVPLEAVGDPHTVTVSMDSNEISMIINSIKEECFRSGVAEAPGGSKAPSIDGKEDLDLAEKMDIAVSYKTEKGGKFRNVHCRRCNMARKLKIMENEKHPLDDEK